MSKEKVAEGSIRYFIITKSTKGNACDGKKGWAVDEPASGRRIATVREEWATEEGSLLAAMPKSHQEWALVELDDDKIVYVIKEWEFSSMSYACFATKEWAPVRLSGSSACLVVKVWSRGR